MSIRFAVPSRFAVMQQFHCISTVLYQCMRDNSSDPRVPGGCIV